MVDLLLHTLFAAPGGRQQRLAEFTWRPSCWWGPCKDSQRCDALTDRKDLGWNLISRRKESQTLRRRAQSLQKQPAMNVDQQITGCLLVSPLPLLWILSSTSPPSFVFLLSSCLWSPEMFRLWAPGDHEEAAGETGSQHLWFRGGVFWRRQHPLSFTWPPPSLPPPSFTFIFSHCSLLFSRALDPQAAADHAKFVEIMRRRQELLSSSPWNRRFRTRRTFCHVCLTFTGLVCMKWRKAAQWLMFQNKSSQY